MVYGKAYGHARSNVLRVGNFLKKGPYGNGKIKENVVENIKTGNDDLRIDHCVRQKDKDKTEIFKRKQLSFTKSDDPFSNKGAEEDIYQIVEEEEKGDFLNIELEFFDEKKNGKGNKNLPPGPSHKGEDVIQPISPLENHLLILGNNFFLTWICRKCPQGCRGN